MHWPCCQTGKQSNSYKYVAETMREGRVLTSQGQAPYADGGIATTSNSKTLSVQNRRYIQPPRTRTNDHTRAILRRNNLIEQLEVNDNSAMDVGGAWDGRVATATHGEQRRHAMLASAVIVFALEDSDRGSYLFSVTWSDNTSR